LSRWIAERVLRDAPCPTLVVPQASDAAVPFESILCAVDFSPASHAAVREGARLSEACKLPMMLLHVVDAAGSADYVHTGSLSTHEFHRGVGADALKTLQSLVPQPDHQATTRVAVGRPAPEILRAARNMKAPLIVFGAARRTRIGSKLFGKTGQLLRDARGPMLAVPISTVGRQATDSFSWATPRRSPRCSIACYITPTSSNADREAGVPRSRPTCAPTRPRSRTHSSRLPAWKWPVLPVDKMAGFDPSTEGQQFHELALLAPRTFGARRVTRPTREAR
jgi:nucleotide-binding universal stress UspA family protein